MLVKLTQSAKHLLSQCVTDEGMVMLVKLEQPSKHSGPKYVTDDGMVMFFKFEQPRKQLSSKEVIEEGMLMLVRLEQPQKHPAPKDVIRDMWLEANGQPLVTPIRPKAQTVSQQSRPSQYEQEVQQQLQDEIHATTKGWVEHSNALRNRPANEKWLERGR